MNKNMTVTVAFKDSGRPSLIIKDSLDEDMDDYEINTDDDSDFVEISLKNKYCAVKKEDVLYVLEEVQL